MLKINKNIISSITNHFTMCISIITLGLLFHLVNFDYSNNITEIQHSQILLEKLIKERK